MPSADDITLDFEDCGHDTPLGDYEGISWDEGWTVYDVTATDCYIGSDPASEPYVAASHFSGSDATYDKLGFDFPSRVVFVGAWFSGAFYLLYPIDLAMSVELIGYVDGVQTFFSGARSLPAWDGNSFPMTFIELNWPGVDRVEVIPKDAYGGPGYFAMDDVIYRDSGTPGAYAGGVPGTDWPHTKRYSAYEGSVTVLDAGLSYDPDGDSLEYRWDIGEDGDWDTGWSGEPTLSRVFTSSTSFIVEVSDGVNTDWDRAYVDFIRLLEAGFTWSPEPPQADVDIQFTDTSTSYPDEIVAWSWDFGDGSRSTEQNPIHAFDLAGKYTVTLTVTDEDGDSDSVEEILNLGGVTKRYAFTNFYDCDPWTELTEYRGITWDPGWYAVGEYIEFPIVGEIPWTTTWMGVAAGNFDEEWYLDEEWYSTEPTLATTYGLDFPCILDVYEAQFCGASTKPGFFNFIPHSPAEDLKIIGYRGGEQVYQLMLSLLGVEGNNYLPTVVQMNWESVDRLEIVTCDGPDDPVPGFFSMSFLNLKVKNPPIAGFTWSPEPPQVDTEIQFTDTSTSYPDEIATWSWDFGDGSTSTEQNPIHVYDSAGTYMVTLTVRDFEYFTDLDWATLSIKEPPVLHDTYDGDWEWSAVYSDPVSITLSLTEDDLGLQPLQNQAGEPKTVYLEYYDGVDWSLIDEDTLSDPGDADISLVYSFETQEGEALDVPAGDHSIRFRFEGDSLYGGLTQPGTLTVMEETPLMLDADDGDWEWETTYSDEITITLELMDDELENLYHQFDEPKTVSLERPAGPYWFLVASDVLEDPASGDTALEFTFTPSASGLSKGENVVRFVYDGDSRYLGETVEGTINVLNTPPVANDMVVSTDEDTPRGIFLSFSDIDDPEEALTIDTVDAPDHGRLSRYDPMIAPPSVYTPDPNWHGTDSFTFRVTDPDGAWDEGVVTITVNSVDDIPAANNDQAVTQEDTTITIDVLANDDGLGDGILSLMIETPPGHGSVQVEPDNTITYSPSEDHYGDDSFEYTVEDVDHDTSTGIVEITVLPVNDPPWSNDDELVTDEDKPVSFTLDYGDVDDPVSDLVPTIVTPPDHGELEWGLPGDEEFHARYTPDPDWHGTDSFTYRVTDYGGLSDIATVTITVNPVNDPPVAEDDSVTTDEDTPVSYNVLSNDLDEDPHDVLQARLITGPSHVESFTLYSDGWFEYVPEENYNSRHPEEGNYIPDSFTYEVVDDDGASDAATVYITVLPVNDPPVAEDQEAETDEDTYVTFTLECSDVDVGQVLTLSITTSPGHGQLEVKKPKEDDPIRVRYTPDPNYNGLDDFTYKVTDPDGAWDEATVTITVNPVNDPPVAEDQEATTNEDTAVNLLMDYYDVDDLKWELDITVVSPPEHGSYAFALDVYGCWSSVTYDPDHDWYGTDIFTCTVTDPDGAYDTVTFTIHVIPVNDPPWSNEDEFVTDEDKHVSFTLDYGDVDDPADDLVPTIVTPPKHGELEWGLPGDEEFHARYTPDPDWFGTDSFTYTVFDGKAYGNVATVTITVNPVNDPPVAADDYVTTDEDTPVGYNVQDNDHDVETVSLSVNLLTEPNHAESFTLYSDGWFEYVPEENYNSRHPEEDNYIPDSFTYEVVDDDGASDAATVYITVNPVNDPPVANDQEAETDEDTYVTVTLDCFDVDVGQLLTLSITTSPGHGQLEVKKPKEDDPIRVRYTPDPNYNGLDSFTYMITDPDGAWDEATVTVTVNPVNDPPVAIISQPLPVDEGSKTTLDASGSQDIDGDAIEYRWDLDGNGVWDTSWSTDPSTSHTYYDDGVFEVAVEVRDLEYTDTDTAVITVNDLAPAASFSWSPEPQAEGSSVYFTDESTSSPDAIVGWSWDFAGLGVSTEKDPEFTFPDDGTYTVTLTVTDEDGSTDTISHTVTVDNVAPSVEAGPDKIVNEGDSFDFSGSFTDPGADTWTFEWTFGDGNEATGTLTPNHAYGDNGVYTVTLTVEDDDGGVGTDTLTVTVLNVPPTADAGPDMADEENTPLTFSGLATDPGTGDTHTYEWDFDYDFSTFDADHSGQEVTHTWTDDWEGTVALRVTDDEGGWDVDTLHVTISNVAPEAHAGEPQTADEGATVAFSGSASDQSPDDTLSYTWDFGDGSPVASGTLSPEHVYVDDGTYMVTLTVDDDDEGTATCTTTVTVINVAPTVDAGEDQNVYVGEMVQFNGQFSDPGDDTHTITWEFGDGGSETGTLEPTHVYASGGDHLVTLTVTDDDGGVGSDTLTVHALKIHAAVDFDPDTLNLKSGGNYVTCYIELQEGFTADMIDPATVVLNGEVPAEPKPVNVGDQDEDGVPDLMVKFSKTIIELLLEPGEAEIIVTGELYNGLVFDGGDKVTVIAPGKEEPKHRVVEDGDVYGEFKVVKVKQGKKSASIILEGGTVYSPFTQWIAAAEAGDPYTLDGEITISSDEGEEAAEWSFHRAFPLKWEGPAFDSSSSEPQLIEVIELAVEKVTRLR